MPKRSLDISGPTTMDSERVQKKTERSHEENQERAYIAASRRADRSIEARVQSARMASEIHKKRTGKGFKISEEIVLREEMYEEEDDDLPRHYRALAAHLQTSSEEMNSRLNAYITNQVAMRTLARHQEVNRRFSESFPNLTRMSQNLSQSAYFQPLREGRAGPVEVLSSSQALHHSRSKSISHTNMSPRPLSISQHQSLSPARLSVPSDDQISTPALTPASGDSDSSQSGSPLTFAPAQPCHPTTISSSSGFSGPGPVDPAFVSGSSQHSSFTAELPHETKLLANIDMSDPLANAFYGMPGDSMGMAGMGAGQFAPPVSMAEPIFMTKDHPLPASDGSCFGTGLQTLNRFPDFSSQGSRIGTPGGGDGDSWDAWVNTDELCKLETEIP